MVHNTATQRQTATQRSTECALIRLDPKRAGFSGSPEIKAALESIRGYLDSWVYPHLEYAAGHPEEFFGQHKDLRRDALLKNISAQAKARAALDTIGGTA